MSCHEQARAIVAGLSGRYGPSGVIVEVEVGVSESREKALAAHGVPISPAIRLPFLVDTGAGTSLVNDQTMRSLGIVPRGQRGMLTAVSDAGPTVCDTYDISLVLGRADDVLRIQALEVFGRPFLSHSVEGLLGRDVIRFMTLTIDGPQQRFRLGY